MIVETIHIKRDTYDLTEQHMKKMESAGISSRNVRTRLIDGWLLEDAIQAPKGMRRSEWMQHKETEDEMKNKLERLRQRQEAELRRKKPHLFTVPQKHGRDKWCIHLMENDIFPKVVR